MGRWKKKAKREGAETRKKTEEGERVDLQGTRSTQNGERGVHILSRASFRSSLFGFVSSAVHVWYIPLGGEALRSAGRTICSGKVHHWLVVGGLAEAATGPPVPPYAIPCFTRNTSRGVVDPSA